MKKPTAFGKYFLLERINVGGMAEVFRSKAFGVEGFERLVAVKRILPSIAEDKEFIRLFIEEAKLAVQLNHANIAQIFDLGVVDGSYYIALEHVHGRDLRAIFERCRTLGEAMPLAQACFIAMKVCEGLDYAHNKRDQAGRELHLVHRDVSPQNILVSFEGEVKLIDFGVAKAATPATQSGILRDKLGYMSPEQAHGLTTTQPHLGSASDSDSFAADAFASGVGTLPQGIDRRSDVYSCGIVLYELITGERLFSGDDPFSTILKVRGAEILPPSTYNRRIPDELERIVLKALAKNVGDRYQSAIDFHDELQAYVYTTGEFYSRKDLAAWMKKTFAKEIEDETAKLDSYRLLKPPAADEQIEDTIEDASIDLVPVVSGSLSVIARPAPKPARPGATIKPPTSSGPSSRPLGAAARSREASIPLPVATLVSPPITMVSPPPAEALVRGAHADEPTQEISDGSIEVVSRGSIARLDPSAIGWEDDEVETQIYKDQEPTKKPARRPSLPSQPPIGSSAGIPLPTDEPASGVEISPELEADLGKIPSLAKPADRSARERRSVVAKLPSKPDPEPTQPMQSVSGEFAAMGTTEVSESDMPPPRFDLHDDTGAAPRAMPREISASSRLVSSAPPPRERRYDPAAPFGARFTERQRAGDKQRTLIIALASSAVGVLVVIVYMLMSGGEPTKVPPPPVARSAASVPTDASTGFDLYVTPSGIMQWKLDGESRTDRLPSRIRGIAPGTHTVQIEPPPGFLTESRQVVVEYGKSSRVEIKLQPMSGIVGTFESTPPAATVSLIIDGKRQVLGPSPAKAVLDPRSSYQVLFEKPGYVSINRPIQLSGGLDERVSVALERVGDDRPAQRAAAPATPTEPQGQGVLSLGSKPPCEILVDGEPTGLRTPQPALKLPAGRRQITLVNSEFNIRETFTVEIKPDATEKLIKDYSDRLPR